MCNLYSITRALKRSCAGSLPPRDLTGKPATAADVYPDQLAPIVPVADGERQLETRRWACQGRQPSAAPVTNIRNTKSPP